MSRPKKKTVDYFPHQCEHKKTMFILEQRYGNDGYAFWFKLLELLGAAEGHYYDLRNPDDWEFLQAKTRLDGETCTEILDLLARLDAIDSDLWSQRVVWCQNFVDGVEVVYRNRRVETPVKPSFYKQEPEHSGVSTDKKPQSRVEYSKEEKSMHACAREGGSKDEPAPRDAQQETSDEKEHRTAKDASEEKSRVESIGVLDLEGMSLTEKLDLASKATTVDHVVDLYTNSIGNITLDRVSQLEYFYERGMEPSVIACAVIETATGEDVRNKWRYLHVGILENWLKEGVTALGHVKKRWKKGRDSPKDPIHAASIAHWEKLAAAAGDNGGG